MKRPQPILKRSRVCAAMMAALSAATIGCGTTSYRQDGSIVKHHFGYVRVITPRAESTSGKFEVLELSTVGVRFHESLGVGWFHERTEYIPLDSRIVVRVANEKQLQQVIETLKPIVKDGLCVTTVKQ